MGSIDSEPVSFVEQIDWEPLVSSSTCNNLLLVNIIILFLKHFLKVFCYVLNERLLGLNINQLNRKYMYYKMLKIKVGATNWGKC